jgi:hypothetical protein
MVECLPTAALVLLRSTMFEVYSFSTVEKGEVSRVDVQGKMEFVHRYSLPDTNHNHPQTKQIWQA